MSDEDKNMMSELMTLIKNVINVLMRDKNICPKSKKKSGIVKCMRIPLPYLVSDLSKCDSLNKEKGLYTQCENKKQEKGDYCLSCEKNMKKKGLSSPEYGTIHDRAKYDIYSYIDPKGNKQVAYSKVMKSLSLTKEDVLSEAMRQGKRLDDYNFEDKIKARGRPRKMPNVSEKVEKVEKGKRGRPRKAERVLEINDAGEDLFAALISEANNKAEVESVKGPEKGAKVAENAAEVAEKASKAAEKAADKTAKAAEKAADKTAKAVEKAAEKAAKVAEKAAEKAAKVAEKAADKTAKVAEKAAKVAEKAAEKAAKDVNKSKSVDKKTKKNKKDEEDEKDEKDEEEVEIVRKIEYMGKKYLRSKQSGIIYDLDEFKNNGDQVVIGKWNTNTNKIDFNVDGEDSEEDEES